MSADLHGFLRLTRNLKSDDAQQYRAGLMSLFKDMRAHLEIASRLMTRLTTRRGERMAK
jgi:hypothetical protein